MAKRTQSDEISNGSAKRICIDSNERACQQVKKAGSAQWNVLPSDLSGALSDITMISTAANESEVKREVITGNPKLTTEPLLDKPNEPWTEELAMDGRKIDETVWVKTMAGTLLATISPVPPNVLQLKQTIFEQTAIPIALQKLLAFDGAEVYEDDKRLDASSSLSLLMIKDETAMFTWDIAENSSGDQLELEGNSIVTCPRMRTDYINVLSKEPIRNGVHYFEFVMHFIGDEQSCGLVADPRHAGPRASLRCLKGWTYYCGRVGHGYAGRSLRDGKGALHALGTAVVEFKRLQKSGDVIGMLVDMDVGAIAFDLNGELQGACAIATDKPLYCLTHLDTNRDKVELRKPCLQDAPPANLEALQGALLDIAKGEKLYGFEFDD